MFRVKICGVTQPEQVAAIAKAGADAIGLNFYPRSKRYISREVGKQIALGLPESVAVVGVFVDPTLDELRTVASSVPITHLQLHGDEPPEMLAAVRDDPRLHTLKLIKAFRIREGNYEVIDEFLSSQQRPDAILVDAFVPQEHGGTGKTVDWEGLQQVDRSNWPPLILAGGLNATNVADAIKAVRPHAVDTASGVESSPGVKDLELVKLFVKLTK